MQSLSYPQPLYINMASESNIFELPKLEKLNKYIQLQRRVKAYLRKNAYALIYLIAPFEKF